MSPPEGWPADMSYDYHEWMQGLAEASEHRTHLIPDDGTERFACLHPHKALAAIAPLIAKAGAPRIGEAEFVAASVAVWREIDRLSDLLGGYRGLDASTDLRIRERRAWETYRDAIAAEEARERP